MPESPTVQIAVPDLWQLDTDSPAWLPSIINRLLDVGVPPTAISNAFEVDVEAIKEIQMDRRTAKYGTAELAEAMHALMWKAYEDTLNLIKQAPPARRLQLNMTLLSKASTLVGSQTPDGVSKMLAEFGNLASEQRRTDQAPRTNIYETSPLDAPANDPKEGSTSRTTGPG